MFQFEFSPPGKKKTEPDDETDYYVNYNNKPNTSKDRKPTKVSTNLCNKFKKSADDNFDMTIIVSEKNKANPESCISFLEHESESCSDTQKNHEWSPKNVINQPTSKESVKH